MILADNRYIEQVEAEAPDWERVLTADPAPAEVARLVAGRGIRRLGMEADRTPHAAWLALEAASPGLELVPVEESLAELRTAQDARPRSMPSVAPVRWAMPRSPTCATRFGRA